MAIEQWAYATQKCLLIKTVNEKGQERWSMLSWRYLDHLRKGKMKKFKVFQAKPKEEVQGADESSAVAE